MAANAALALAVGALLVVAVRADGFRAHEAQLNDGGIWVTNARDGFHGRINKPIEQLDSAVFADVETDLDVVQDGGAVVGINRSAGLIAPIDPGTVSHPDGEEAAIPGDAPVQLAGGSLAVIDPVAGALWAHRFVDGEIPLVTDLDRDADPLAELGGEAALAVTLAGDVLVASAEEAQWSRFRPAGTGFAEPEHADLPDGLDERLSLTALGDTAVGLDGSTGHLAVEGGGSATLGDGAVLQQPGPAVDDVLVATGDRLLAVDLATGEADTLAEGVSGRPTEPVRLGACAYGAWSGGTGAVVTVCGDAEPVVARLGGNAADLVFRVNRGEIVLNDRATGAVWNIDSDRPARIDDWDAFRNKVTEEDEEEENEKEERGDRRPPKAMPDDFGARPGRTTVLHPLDNDTAPEGRILSIRSVQDISDPDARITISPDGQTVQIRLPERGARATSFEYHIDDGRQGLSAHATVRVGVRQPSTNGRPHLREGFEERIWAVPAEGSLDIPVLPDWRDNQDGDPLSLVSATALGGERTGASAQVLEGGRIRFSAPAKGGLARVRYTVTDGRGEPERNELEFQVQDPRERRAVPAVAEPDVVSGEAGEPITIRPLGNDLPGADPITPDATLELAGKVPATGGADVRTDLVGGTVQFRSDVPKTYFLDYEAAYGNAAFADGRIRVDVRPPSKTPPEPVAMPDTVTLRGQTPTLVDVLANDIDPAGGMLVVTGARPKVTNQVDLAVVDGRWLRLSARQGTLAPSPQVVHYTISNGTHSGIEGEVVVSQRPEPEDTTPVTEPDQVTVRAGSAVSVPVLDNDFSPAGDRLELVGHVSGERSGRLPVQRPGDEKIPTGQAFATGRFVRYVAPTGLEEPQTFTVRYLAQNAAGETAPGVAELTVIPADAENRLPEPPVLEGRTVAGDTITLRLPGADVDPDGDAVTLLGIESAPALGRVVRHGANSLEYQAYPGGAGTDEFTYRVTDPFGGVATGVARIAVVPPASPQPPLAVDDTLTVEPGRKAFVDALANDLVAPGDRVTLELVDPPEGVRLETDTGPIVLDAPGQVDGRNLEVVYTVSNGLDSSRATVTVRTAEPYNNPPVVPDSFGETEDGDSVSVDVLESAHDPDGPSDELAVTQVFAPDGVVHSLAGSELTVARGPEPVVVPFRVEDADGGSTTASLYVPAAGSGPPQVKPDSVVDLDPGESTTERLADYVVDPAGGEVAFTLRDRIWASPAESVTASITGDGKFEVAAADGYRGPGAVVFEVSTGATVDDEEGQRAVVSVPVQVGRARPVLRCPDEEIEVAQGERLQIDVAALCHVWTADPDEALALSFTADWERSSDGLAIIEPQGSIIEVAADGGAPPDTRGVLALEADGGRGELGIKVVAAPPPSMAPIRVADMRAGESRTIDLAPYLRPGVSDPEPTVVQVEQLTSLDMQIVQDGKSAVTLTTGERVDGVAEFSVVMSDVPVASGNERLAEGRIRLEVLDRPDTPLAPVPGRTVRSQEIHLEWRAPEPNGAPITRYEVRADDGSTHRCASTSCDITGLTNGRAYRFKVRARNAIGWSDESPWSAKATPDAKPGPVGPIRVPKGGVGDGQLTLVWSPPTTQTSAIRRYHVSWPGGSKTVRTNRATVTGLDNNKQYTFTVQAENALDVGEAREGGPFQSVGTPQAPPAPTITDQKTPGDEGAVTITWPETDPNGPTPLRYTVLRNGNPLPACTDITVNRCDNQNITYDGKEYHYAVKATNDGGKSNTGPTSSWSAVGEPAAWQDWTIKPNGTDHQATAQFTVPDSRGAESKVSVIVNGVVRSTDSLRGAQTRTVTVPDNDGPHNVSFRVCNESGACSASSTKSVQTYGPLRKEYITIQPTVSGTSVSWRITVDTNGNAASVHVESNQRSTQKFTASGVDVHTFTLPPKDIGYSSREKINVILFDDSPKRGPVEKPWTSPQTAEKPPPPEVRIFRGDKCNDGNPNVKDCNLDGTGVDCVSPECGHITVRSWNFDQSTSLSCTFRDSGGPFKTRIVQANTTQQTRSYYGNGGSKVWAKCVGDKNAKYTSTKEEATSPAYTWPNS